MIEVRDKRVVADVYYSKRAGRDSPYSIYFLVNGQWITAAHQRYGLAKVKDQFNLFFHIYLPYELLVEEMTKPSPLWLKIPKDNIWSGGTFLIPISNPKEPHAP